MFPVWLPIPNFLKRILFRLFYNNELGTRVLAYSKNHTALGINNKVIVIGIALGVNVPLVKVCTHIQMAKVITQKQTHTLSVPQKPC